MQFVCIFFHICWIYSENLNFQFPKVEKQHAYGAVGSVGVL